jgi:rare lipoprotein A
MRRFATLLATFGCLTLVGGCPKGLNEAQAGTMMASWYDCKAPGQCSKSKRTASGAQFNPNGLTAAHRTLPLGTRLRVCHRGCVVVVVNDRGPASWTGKDIDLSAGAARAIGMGGSARIQVSHF